jgi:hypothetical protein
MRYLLAFAAILALLISTGCTYMMAVPSTAGKAWAVKVTPFGGTYWNCEAAGGKPKCYKVIKQ